MGKGVSTAINSVLCQFSGLETDADDMLVCSLGEVNVFAVDAHVDLPSFNISQCFCHCQCQRNPCNKQACAFVSKLPSYSTNQC